MAWHYKHQFGFDLCREHTQPSNHKIPHFFLINETDAVFFSTDAQNNFVFNTQSKRELIIEYFKRFWENVNETFIY